MVSQVLVWGKWRWLRPSFITGEFQSSELLLFIYLFFNFYFYFIPLYNTVLVLPYIDMNPPQVYTCSPSEPLSLLPPCTVPLGHPSAPAPSILYPALNLDWWFISYMILYMFQCHSPKSSHPPFSLSHRVQKTVLYIPVSFAVSHRGLSLPSF